MRLTSEYIPELNSSIIKCGFCCGTGEYLFDAMSSLASCNACGGDENIVIEPPFILCEHCRGSGTIPKDLNDKTLTCTVCSGKGVIAAPTHTIEICSECFGSGEDTCIPALSCLKCHGKGWILTEDSEG